MCLVALSWQFGAQATATIRGPIRDAFGLAVPGAGVNATQTETRAVRSTIGGPDGAYVLKNLAIGLYRLEISRTGFSTYLQTGTVLPVGSQPTIRASLKIGNLSEEVNVEAGATLVETQSTKVGSASHTQKIIVSRVPERACTV